MEKLDAELNTIVEQIKSNFEHGECVPVSDFARKSTNKHTLVKMVASNYDLHENHLSKERKGGDYPGIYVFAEKQADSGFRYVYVGISRMVIQRLSQHLNYTDRRCATWAYLMARYPDVAGHPIRDKRSARSFDSPKELKEAIEAQQADMAKRYWVTYYPIDDNYLLHLAEPFVACTLKAYWNSFKTH